MSFGGILHNLAFFILAIGVLVTFHEFGHYWVARKLNVKVLRFSVGFGKPLLMWKRKRGEDEIEFAIAAIPLGGYVKMLDEREAPVDEHLKHRAFNTQPVGKRAAIVVAGPLFNFILAIVLYWIVLLGGETGTRPIIDAPKAGSIAALSGFEVEDEIVSIGDSNVLTWNDFHLQLINHGIDGGDLNIKVKTSAEITITRVLKIGDMHLFDTQEDVLDRLGFDLWRPEIPPVIYEVVEKTPAYDVGLRPGDRILAINNEPIETWAEMEGKVRGYPGQLIDVLIERDGIRNSYSITTVAKKFNGKSFGAIGVVANMPDDAIKKLTVHVKYNLVEAFNKAVTQSWDMSVVTLSILGKMLLGEATLDNISGPFTIAKYAGVTASIGADVYLKFLAAISVSLFVLNLLPVPMLDGGHLFYYVVELVKGSPVSEKFEEMAQQVGLAVLLMLMALAIYNDIQRLLN